MCLTGPHALSSIVLDYFLSLLSLILLHSSVLSNLKQSYLTIKFPSQAKVVYVVYKFVDYASSLNFHGPIKLEEQPLPDWLYLQECVK
jgi:hypothetical protein